jgi:hypothetical protein
VTQENFCIDSVLKDYAVYRKRQLSALPEVGSFIYTILKCLALQGVPYIYIYTYDISRLRLIFYNIFFSPITNWFLLLTVSVMDTLQVLEALQWSQTLYEVSGSTAVPATAKEKQKVCHN